MKGVMSNALSGLLSKKPKPEGKRKVKVVADETGIEDVYTIPDMLPKTVIMSREMKRRHDEDSLRNKHGAKKEKSATIM